MTGWLLLSLGIGLFSAGTWGQIRMQRDRAQRKAYVLARLQDELRAQVRRELPPAA